MQSGIDCSESKKKLSGSVSLRDLVVIISNCCLSFFQKKFKVEVKVSVSGGSFPSTRKLNKFIFSSWIIVSSCSGLTCVICCWVEGCFCSPVVVGVVTGISKAAISEALLCRITSAIQNPEVLEAIQSTFLGDSNSYMRKVK